MIFTIVAKRNGVSVYNRRAAAREALFLASARVQEGADKVMVYDERWQFVSAAVLAEAARSQLGPGKSVKAAVDEAVADLQKLEPQPYVPSPGVTISLRGEAEPSASLAPAAPESPPARTGRVRVFRARDRRD